MSRQKREFKKESVEIESEIEQIDQVEKEIETIIDPCNGCEWQVRKSQRFCGSCINYKK